MRRAAKIDGNQVAVVDALRRIGASVMSLAARGDGCPDLLVGYKGHTVLLEVKDGRRKPSERRLTPDQEAFWGAWQGGPLKIVESPTEAIQTVLGLKERVGSHT